MNSEILVKFKGDTKDLENATNKAKTSTTNLGTELSKGLAAAAGVATVAIAATATAVVNLSKATWQGIQDVAAYGDAIDKNSQKVGLSKRAYQQWDYVMQISGTSMQDCTVGMKTLTNKFDDLKSGSKGATETFNRLGISLKDLQGLSREEVFRKTVESLQNVKDETEKAALANDLFGKSGQNLMPMFNMTNKELDRLIEETEKYGMVMSDDAVSASAAFQDSMTKLTKTANGLKNKFFGALLPGITDITDGFSNMVAGIEGGDKKVEEGIDKVVNKFSEMVPKVVETFTKMMPKIFEAAGKIIISIVKAIVENMPKVVPAMQQVMLQLIQTIMVMLPQILEASFKIISSVSKGIAEAIPTLVPVITEVILKIVEVLLDNIDLLIEAQLLIMEALAEGLIDALPIIVERIPTIVVKIVEAIIRLLPKLWEVGKKMIKKLLEGVEYNYGPIINWFRDLPYKLFDLIVKGLSHMKNAGSQLMQGLYNGLTDKWNNLKGSVNNLGNGIVNKFKSVFGIHSPSKVMKEQIGINIGLGMIEGLNDTENALQKQIDGISTDMITGLSVNAGNLNANLSPQLLGTANTHLSPQINVVVNNEITQDPLGQMVNNIKTFSGGSKNDYNYGMGR